MHVLTGDMEFPDVSLARQDGLLAIGGDLAPERLIKAYKSGIFPWFEIEEPILWWSPDPRFVLFPKKLKISKSMKKILRDGSFRISINADFAAVIQRCAAIERNGQSGTWITDAMIAAYTILHDMGYAKSVEVWQDDKLVAGFYGIEIGTVFCGESMFADIDNASKAGFISFIQNSPYKLIDCQIYTRHFESLGAEMIPRTRFLDFLKA